MNTYYGTNLYQTAAHEFGHSLGLSHSDQSKALMSPFYRGYQKTVKLDKDDIHAITSLYGEKNEESTSSPSIHFPQKDKDIYASELCFSRSGFDTIVSTGDEEQSWTQEFWYFSA